MVHLKDDHQTHQKLSRPGLNSMVNIRLILNLVGSKLFKSEILIHRLLLSGSLVKNDHHVIDSNLKRYCWKWRRIEATNLTMASSMCILERIYSWVVNRNRYQNDLWWRSWPRMNLRRPKWPNKTQYPPSTLKWIK